MISCGNDGSPEFPQLFDFDRMEVETTSFYSVENGTLAMEQNIPSTVKDKFEAEIESGDLLEILR